MTHGDETLLAALAHALGSAPFADTVMVLGLPLSREVARRCERQLLLIRSERRKSERKAA